MAVHLIKMAVGIEDLDDLIEYRRKRRESEGEGPCRIRTRHMPKREAELVDGGSIYWVIRGQISVRQLVVGFRSERDENGRRYCLIDVDRTLVSTLWRPCRPFQGWRYLLPEAVPLDRAPAGELPLPDHLLTELRALGLL